MGFLNAKEFWRKLPDISYLCFQHKMEVITDHCDSFWTGQNQGFRYALIQDKEKSCSVDGCEQHIVCRLEKVKEIYAS